jgi:mRNA interferase MazF
MAGIPAVCQLTSELADASDFRVTIEPKPKNGSRLKSQVMADKPVTATREQTGRFGNQDMARLGIAWRLPWGRADWHCFSPIARFSPIGNSGFR